MASYTSNNFKDLLANKEIDFAADTFKIILMEAGFAFSRAAHDEYADVSADELATAFGYTAGGATLAGVAVTRSDVTNSCIITWSNVSWVATGGNLEACGAIIYDNTVANDPIIGFIDFASTVITYNGGTFTVANPTVTIS